MMASASGLAARFLARLRRGHLGSWVLRALVVAGPVMAVGATGPAGNTAPRWFTGLVALIAAGWALYPESSAGVLVMVLTVAWWGIALRDGLQPEAVLAAGALLVAHVAAVLASYGPPDVVLDPALVRRWVLRAVLVLLPTPVLLWLTLTVAEVPEPPLIWLAAVVMLLAAGAAVVVRTQRVADG
jgi:hypothetical protein